MAGQYLLEWEPARYPEGGTYLGPVDFAFNGPDRQFLSAALGFASRGQAVQPSQHGEFGLATRWAPQWLDGTVGLYYRNFADKLPQVLLTKVGAASASQYNLIYADNIQLFGASIAKNIGGVSTSAEVSYRKNTPLNAQVLGIAPGLPDQGDTKGPRGNTLHGLMNVDRHDRQDAGVRRGDLGRRAERLASGHGDQRREPVQRRRLRAVRRQGQVGRLRDAQLRRRRRLVHADLVPGPTRESTCRRR